MIVLICWVKYITVSFYLFKCVLWKILITYSWLAFVVCIIFLMGSTALKAARPPGFMSQLC